MDTTYHVYFYEYNKEADLYYPSVFYGSFNNEKWAESRAEEMKGDYPAEGEIRVIKIEVDFEGSANWQISD